MTTILIGNIASAFLTIRVTATGALTDPGTLTATVRLPDASTETFEYGTDDEWEKVSTGVYRFDYDTTGKDDGIYRVRIASTGAGQAAVERYFRISPSAL